MGLVTGALQIGRSALLAYQSALQVVGNNISNVATDGYTRQTPLLSPATGITLPEGFQPGGGVALTGLRRNVDETLESRYRVSLGQESGSAVRQQILGRIEGLMNELTDTDLSTLLGEFFNSFSTLQTKPHETAARTMVLTAAQSVTREIQRQRTDVYDLRQELNRDLAGTAEQVNQLAKDVAELNVRIAEMESTGGGMAGTLRDQRDAVLRDMAGLVQIQTREQPNGAVNVYLGNEPLIQAGLARELTATTELVDGQPLATVRFADSNSPVSLLGGTMAGMLAARDTDLGGQIAQLDSLARALITEVNKLHSSGQGLVGFGDLTGSYDVHDATVALNSTYAGLDLRPVNGSFVLKVKDQAGGESSQAVIGVDLDGIGADESLTTLAAKINAAGLNVNATVTADNRLRVTAAAGYEFAFGEDTSGALAALGMNTFFGGHDSSDLSVNASLVANPDLLAAGVNGTPGDGSNAGRIAALADGRVAGLNGRSINDYYNAIVSDVAVRGAAAKAGAQAYAAVNMSLASQRESISGVNLDEETISMLRLERAFQGAARYSSTVDRLIGEMLSLLQ